MLSTFSFSQKTIGFLIDGDFNTKAVDELEEVILDKINQHGAVNLFLEDDGIENFTLSAVIQQIYFKHKHALQINKIAVVSDMKWAMACVAFEKLFLSSTIKHFAIEDRLDALSWISDMS